MKEDDPRIRFRITTGRHDGSLPPSISASFTVTDEQFWQLVRAYNQGRSRDLFVEALIQASLQEEGRELLAETGQEERADNPQDKRQTQEGELPGHHRPEEPVTETGETYDRERERIETVRKQTGKEEGASRTKLAPGLGVHVLRKETGTYTAQEAGS